jgi:hypothetical protein
MNVCCATTLYMYETLTHSVLFQIRQGVRQSALLIDLLSSSPANFLCPAVGARLLNAALNVSSAVLAAYLRTNTDVLRKKTLHQVAMHITRALTPPVSSLCGETGAFPALRGLQLRLGFRRNDLAAAEMEATAMLNPIKGMRVSQPPPLLDLLLSTAVNERSTAADDRANASLASILKKGPLRVMRSIPLEEIHLTTEGWAAYFLLEPIALQRWLAESLKTMIADQQPSTRTIPHWEYVVDAIAQNPAIHVAARRLLRAWFSESGNFSVWQLMHSLFNRTIEPGSVRCATMQVTGLPTNFKLLYDRSLHEMAEQVFITQQTEAASADTLIAAEKALRVAHAAGATDEDVWQVVLDGVEITRAALAELVPMVTVQLTSGTGLTSAKQVEARAAASSWISWLLWPLDLTQRGRICAALQNPSEHSGTMCPLLPMLNRWQNLFSSLSG